MKLSELTTPYEKHRIIQYGSDGRKVVRHYMELRSVGGNVYMSRPEPDQWMVPRFDLCLCYEGVPDGVLVYPGSRLTDELTDDMVIQSFQKNSMDTPERYLAMLDAAVVEDRFIGNAQIAFVEQFAPDKAAVYTRHRAAYYKRRRREEVEKWERRLREEAAYCKEQNEKAEAAVNEAVALIQNGGVLKNDSIVFYRSKYGASTYSIVNYLMRRYGIEVPLRTQGWINTRLIYAVIEKDGRCSFLRYDKQKNGRGSQKFFQHMNELIAVVRDGAAPESKETA